MTTVTHVLAPILVVRVIHLLSERHKHLNGWDYLWIGIAGGLADIINPHYYLSDRLTSWSHGLPFWLLFSLVILLIAVIAQRSNKFKFLTVAVAFYCSFAYLLHLFVDALSGGINLFYPLFNYNWGYYLIPFPLWIPADILNLALVYIAFKYFAPNSKNRVV